MQKCNVCKQEKDFGEFSWERKGVKRSPRCKQCQSSLSKKHYQKNSDDYKRYRNKYKLNIQKRIYQYLKDNPCIKCGESNPVVLELDHRDPKLKEFNISSAPTRRVSVKKLDGELAKCDVLCANCHRIKTARDLGFYTYKFMVEDGSDPDPEPNTSLKT